MLPHTRTTDDAHRVQTGDELLSPLQQWANTHPTRHEPRLPHDGRHIGMTDVDGIRSVTAAFRDVDNRHGGAVSRKAVLAQINDAVATLDSCTYTEPVGQALFSAVADLGSVAAWMTFDAGHHRTAQHIFITALHAASEGGDRRVGAHILQCMARQMSHLDRYDDALDLVALAQYGARRHMSPAMKSMLQALEARFHAILGNLDDSETAAGRAEDAFTKIEPVDEPAYMAFFDEAELSATVGVAHQIAAKASQGTGRARRAEKSLLLMEHATGLRPEHRVRSKAFDHLGMARTHLAVGDLDGAHQETGRALDLFGKISSRRVADRLTELHDEAEPFASSPLGVDLRQSIASAVR